MSSKTSNVSLTMCKSNITKTPNNSPRNQDNLNRPLTKKEKKGLARKKYRERKKKNKFESSLKDFTDAVNFIEKNVEAINRIAGVGGENEGIECAIQDIANSQMQYSVKEIKKVNRMMVEKKRRKKKAVENFNRNIKIIEEYRKKYPSLAEAYLQHKLGLPKE